MVMMEHVHTQISITTGAAVKIPTSIYTKELQSMATYYNGNSEIQADGLQTLILMNPGYVGYSDTQSPPPGNFVFLNSTPLGNTLSHHHHASPPTTSSQAQQFVGIPLSSQSIHSQHDISALHGFIPRAQYNMYSHPQVDLTAARDVTRFQQGLSLSLSSQQQPVYGGTTTVISPIGGGGADEGRTHHPGGGGGGGNGGGSSSSASGISNGMQSVLLNSKYLNATQELLDEVVNVGKGVMKSSSDQPAKFTTSGGQTKSGGASPAATSGGKGTAELTTAERHEIQMKKAKLVNMLDEVEQRYRQYHNQMQIVISWFEQAAGIGSARTYTALALQTISKQFRCLKDAIMGQINSASKSLGEEDCLGGGKMEGGSRLKFVDNQLRQQRALQQLGMIQHNPWRPQRGLPERSVSVLRAWLFEHFLHPYPKDSDKHMLAKQTGLTRGQVSNWFINARVRLWKPMVEEMYLEEVKEHEQNNGSDDKPSKSGQNNEDSTSMLEKSLPSPDNQNKGRFKSKPEKPSNPPPQMSVSAVSTSRTAGMNFQNHSGFTLIGSSSEMDGTLQFSPKKQRNNLEILRTITSFQSISPPMDTKPGESNNETLRQSRESGFTLMGNPTDFMGGLGAYQIGEIGRFSAEQFQAPYSGNNGVSLTLGLPHCDNLSMSGAHQSFLPGQNIQLGRGVEIGEENEFGTMNNPTSASMYETINIQNRKGFAVQLLQDFVS